MPTNHYKTGMKISEIKQEVYRLTRTQNTKELKKKYPNLTQGRDLRYKAQWSQILTLAKDLNLESDLSLEDLEQSEKMLKESLYKVGYMANLSSREIEKDWQRIQHSSKTRDIHIEEL
ncbi:hypothetical protein [Geitlerinema sp. PCC 9228]|uniref:hypothetical protein n=1 Tax=Geitlerinema sp. PCC 9228 TaxID=111611 RepID=UPI001B8BFC12|nr:hypothetical protein [Geitlerinema sp. PCC 9228]